jgi:hypothetical protein
LANGAGTNPYYFCLHFAGAAFCKTKMVVFKTAILEIKKGTLIKATLFYK